MVSLEAELHLKLKASSRSPAPVFSDKAPPKEDNRSFNSCNLHLGTCNCSLPSENGGPLTFLPAALLYPAYGLQRLFYLPSGSMSTQRSALSVSLIFASLSSCVSRLTLFASWRVSVSITFAGDLSAHHFLCSSITYRRSRPRLVTLFQGRVHAPDACCRNRA